MRAAIPAFATALTALFAVSGPTVSRAEMLESLEGEARPVAAPAAIATPGEPVGGFALTSAEPRRDLRDAPGFLLLFTDRGTLMAMAGDDARRFAPWRRDAESGRPLHPDAPEGARCPTGVEDACWHPGDPVPYSADVADAFDAKLPPIPRVGPPPDWSDTTSIPTVPLNLDPNDGDSSYDSYDGLSDEQEALLGCGPFWGTDCNLDGVDLRRADASVILQSFYGEAQYSSATDLVSSGWSYGDSTGPTTTSADEAVSRNFASGGFGDGEVFRSEMAAMSFNFQLLLVAFSKQPPEDVEAKPGTDPNRFDPQDPFSSAPGRCSFAQPQFCASVADFYALSTLLCPRDDDPAETRRWIWDSGAEYRIVGATGDLESYEGGRAHVLGIERSRTRAAQTGVPLALFPAPGATLAPNAPFAVQAPSDTSGASFGLAYLTAPEPSAAALAVAAIASLATLGRSRRAAS